MVPTKEKDAKMSLYITATHKDGAEWVCEYHVGKCLRNEFVEVLKAFHDCTVMEVQADGNELEAIKRQLENIPFAKGKRVVRWFGDDARFIIANIVMG